MNINVSLLSYEFGQAGLPVVGVASTGRIDYSRPLTVAEQVIANGIVAAHDPNGLLPMEKDELDSGSAKVSFRNLPNYATWTPQEAETNITSMVLGGKTKAQSQADIDALPATITGMKIGMKALSDAIIDVRGVLAIVAKMVIYIRIIVVRRN